MNVNIISNVVSSKMYYRVCCLTLFLIAAAASFNGYYDKWQFREADSSSFKQIASLDVILDGSAPRPYVYRQLLPMAASWIDIRVPEKVKDWLFGKIVHQPLSFDAGYANSPMVRNRSYLLRYLIIYVMVFLSAWVSVYAMYLVGKAMGNSSLTAAFAAIAMILLMPYLFSWGGYFYDYPELAFMAIAAWLALKFDWWWIIPVAALATWNKESFLFFIPTLYPLLSLRGRRTSAMVGTAVLGFTCALVYYFLRMRYLHNPGGAVEFHLMDQVQFLLHPMNELAREETYGVYFFRTFSIFPLVMIVWTAWRGWRHLPRAIQRHAQIAAVINVPLYILFCWPGELRDLSMLYVTLLLLFAANLTVWVGKQSNALVRQPE
jgi:hypothetical protein